ncbi:hypothetical protein MLD38_001395 [Melastoma candidum]|uniref:Uncharacterized protein n=1 Tax=Melastoma candidum TaxID=119954 RepID=A0ACB9SEQ3_9MYRT|nr:hypothetical protein MLD38_001395 [Melastoma candidum]
MQERSHPIPNRANVPRDRFPVRSDGGVVITVYVESLSHSNRHGSNGDTRRSGNGAPRARECFDRRAQLLAYSRDLRSRDASTWKRPGSNADRSPKRKKRRPRWSMARRRLRSLFSRMCRFRTWPRSKHRMQSIERALTS